jgi:hypothetical protein
LHHLLCSLYVYIQRRNSSHQCTLHPPHRAPNTLAPKRGKDTRFFKKAPADGAGRDEKRCRPQRYQSITLQIEVCPSLLKAREGAKECGVSRHHIERGCFPPPRCFFSCFSVLREPEVGGREWKRGLGVKQEGREGVKRGRGRGREREIEWEREGERERERDR